MFRFYKGLKEGLKKDEALRAAKMDYLGSVSKTKMHPYYWAAFVQFGDTEVMEFNTSTPWIFWLGGLLLLIGAFYFLNLRKN